MFLLFYGQADPVPGAVEEPTTSRALIIYGGPRLASIPPREW